MQVRLSKLWSVAGFHGGLLNEAGVRMPRCCLSATCTFWQLIATRIETRQARELGNGVRIIAMSLHLPSRSKRLYKMVEDGIGEMDDWLKDRVTTLKADRGTARAAVQRARGANLPPIVIEQARLEAFASAMRERLSTGEVPFRYAYLGDIIDRVDVDDEQLRTLGRKDVLEHAVLANGGPIPGVRSLVCKYGTPSSFERFRRVGEARTRLPCGIG